MPDSPPAIPGIPACLPCRRPGAIPAARAAAERRQLPGAAGCSFYLGFSGRANEVFGRNCLCGTEGSFQIYGCILVTSRNELAPVLLGKLLPGKAPWEGGQPIPGSAGCREPSPPPAARPFFPPRIPPGARDSAPSLSASFLLLLLLLLLSREQDVLGHVSFAIGIESGSSAATAAALPTREVPTPSRGKAAFPREWERGAARRWSSGRAMGGKGPSRCHHRGDGGRELAEGKPLGRRRMELAEEQTSGNWPGRHILTGPRQHPELERLRCGNDGQAHVATTAVSPRALSRG